MLLNATTAKIVTLESSTEVRILTEGSVETPVTRTLPSVLSYVTFVLFLEDDILLWGGGSAGGRDEGLVLAGDGIIIVRRLRAKPLQCRVLRTQGNGGNEEDNKPHLDDSPGVLFELWVLWSDGMLTSTRWAGLKHGEQQSIYYELNNVSNINDFVVLSEGLVPAVLDHRVPRRQIVLCGSDPGLATFPLMTLSTSSDGASGRQLLAVAAASALTSVVSSFARKWFAADLEDASDATSRAKSEEGDEEEINHITSLQPKVTFDDNREFTMLAVGKQFCAAADTLGRIFLFHAQSLHVTKVLKGYRSPQLAFQNLEGNADVLLVCAPLSRGNRLELWRAHGLNPQTGDGELRPFAHARVSHIPENATLRLANDYLGLHCALFTERQFLGRLDFSALTMPDHPEWEEFFDSLRARLSSSNSKDSALVQALPSMYLEPDTVFRRFRMMEGSYSKANLGATFYERFLNDQKAFVRENGNGEQLLDECDERLALLQVFNQFRDKMTKIQKQPQKNVEDEPDMTSARRWALEVAKEKNLETRNLDVDKLIVYLLDRSSPECRRVLDVFFHVLLGGDVFVVREVMEAFQGKRLGARFSKQDVLTRFGEWWVENPVEASSAWKSPIQSNPLLKFLTEMKLTEANRDTLISAIERAAHGKLGLARAAMLCQGSALIMKLDEVWTREQIRFAKAFQVCVQLYGDNDEDSGFTVRMLDDGQGLRRMIAERCVDFDTAPGPSSKAVSASHESWVRSETPLTRLMSDDLLGRDMFGSPIARDEFRFEVARRALESNKFFACARTLGEFEDLSTTDSIVRYDDLRRHLCMKIIDVLLRKGAQENEEAELVQLLMSRLTSSWQRRLVRAMLLARDVKADEENAGTAKNFADTLHQILSRAGDADRDDDKTIPDLIRKDLDHIFEKTLHADAMAKDDEALRAIARGIGLSITEVDESALNKRLALFHMRHGRDQRGRECFDKISQPEIRGETAAEMLRLCRLRLATVIKAARMNKELAPLLASVSPKIVTWLVSATTNNHNREDQHVIDVPLTSTLGILNTIRGHLPAPVASSSSASTVSLEERCAQLIALVETLLMAASGEQHDT